MVNAEVVERLRQLAAEVDKTVSGTRWILFGSCLHSSAPADVDLAIVARSQSDADRVRGLIYDTPTPEPLDLITMTAAEERELDFVQVVEGLELHPRCDPALCVAAVDTT